MDESRRDPNAFLSLVKEEGADGEKRGMLKIFFGYAAGVGKTYSMLVAARKLKSDNVDVVIGYIEPHGRPETTALLEGLEQIPPKLIEYKGSTFKELDIDAVLKRKPKLILVDELAHTNAEGSRHAKRWQDVQELLDAGIDVFTTVNVQHLETLNDKVNQITRVEVRERVPDSFLEKANEIALVDISPDDLLQRLKEGKVYLPEQARTALNNFFRKGNLIALREMSLLFVAERVEAQMQRYRQVHRIRSTWPASERIIVCVGPSPLSIRLVRAAKRMATALKAEWIVAYVETPAQSNMREEDRNRILETLRLAAELGGQVIELQGHSVPEELIKCALQYNASKIVIGKPARTRLQELINGSVVDEVIRNSGAIDVYVITGEGGTQQARRSASAKKKTPVRQYISAMIIVVLTTLVARCMLPYFELANIVMIYLLGVLVISLRYGRGPSILSSITSVAAFDFFCVPPYLTFAVSDTQYIFTFMVMLTVALVISTLTVRVKQQAEAARTREQRTAFLYRMSRELASTEDIIDLYKIGLRHISEVFDAEASIIIPNENERPSSVMLAPGHYALNSVDLAVAHWVMHNRQVAGAGSQTLPGTPALYLPLLGTNRSLAVLAIKPFEQLRFSSPEQLQLLHTFVNQLSQACERSLLSVENEKAQLQMKTEQLRSSLLSSVSHDLRTPLATITGAASSIIEAPSASLDPEACRERATQIYEESVRLNRLVTNLLDMTRLQSGTLQVRKEWHPVDDLVGAALSYMDDKMGGRTVKTNIPSDLPLVPVDDILIQQVFVNLLENAIKYTPDKATIELNARLEDEQLVFDVADNGPGIPEALRSQVFEKFYRQEEQTTSGAGLGLAICKGIVEAHSGKIWVEENPGGGALFRFTIPIDSRVPNMPPELPGLSQEMQRLSPEVQSVSPEAQVLPQAVQGQSKDLREEETV